MQPSSCRSCARARRARAALRGDPRAAALLALGGTHSVRRLRCRLWHAHPTHSSTKAYVRDRAVLNPFLCYGAQCQAAQHGTRLPPTATVAPWCECSIRPCITQQRCGRVTADGLARHACRRRVAASGRHCVDRSEQRGDWQREARSALQCVVRLHTARRQQFHHDW